VTTYRVTKIGIAKPGRKRKVKTRSPRKTPVKKVNQSRVRKEFIRCYGSKERVAFVRTLPCIVCLSVPSENAHTTSGGISRKADAGFIAPVCNSHHRELHQIGVESFERKYFWAHLSEAAEATNRRWLSHLESTNA
jgi:hypothetical protein